MSLLLGCCLLMAVHQVGLVPLVSPAALKAGGFFLRSILQMYFHVPRLPLVVVGCTVLRTSVNVEHLAPSCHPRLETPLGRRLASSQSLFQTAGCSKCTCEESSRIISCVWSLSMVTTSSFYRLLETCS